MKRYLVIFLILAANSVYSQTGDTLRTQTSQKDTTTKPITPFDINKIVGAYRLSNTSETYGQSNWIWNDRRNLGEILNERPGFMVNFLGDGGRNPINFNQAGNNVGIFMDGIQVNDIFNGGFDIENISINEIDSIEELSNVSSFLYGISTQNKAVNIITKDIFQPELFSQLRFTQDRFSSEFADVYFSQSISRKVNWQIGATKHSLTGRYANSEFDVWRARSRVNFFLSPKVNIRLNLNYANIKRDLNEGLFYSSEDTLKNPELAIVLNPDSYEKYTNFYYDLSLTGRFLKNKLSLTKLNIYSQNSLREYRDEEGSGNTNGIINNRNFHFIQYGLDLKQNFSIIVNQDISGDILIGGNAYINLFDFDHPYMQGVINKFDANYYSGLAKISGNYKGLNISGTMRYDYMFNDNILQYGIEGNYILYKNVDYSIEAFGGLSKKNYGLRYWTFSYYNIDTSYPGFFVSPVYKNYLMYSETGVRLKYKNLYGVLYHYHNSDGNSSLLDYGNYEVGLISEYIDAKAVLNFNFGSVYFNQSKLFLKSDISYHNFFFDDNLNLRIGINIKYLHNLKTLGYWQEYNEPIIYSGFPDDATNIDHLFNMDVYIGARIGSANIALVFANVFNNFNYDTFLYPWNDRGGALNSLSRFTITWDFFN